MRTISFPVALAAVCGFLFAPMAHAADGPFADWAGIFIAGDYKAHSGADSEVFDNGRRDVAKAFVAAGLKPENTIHFSVRPERYASTPEKPYPIKPAPLIEEMTKLTGKAKGGCLFFYTSHGSPEGVVMGDILAAPGSFGRLIQQACGDRPTVAIISACFSGIFVPVLAGSNRVVMTAARRDRSSFGCGESDVYTFFDTCILEELPQAGTFDVLSNKVTTCVEKREREMGMSPPSQPQSTIGVAFETAVKTYALARSYKVKEGDTLAAISKAMYGKDNHADDIYRANRTLFRTRNAPPPAGQFLTIPAV